MTAPLRTPEASKRHPKRPGKRTNVFDQSNATEVWRILDRLMPKPQVEISEAVGISQSGISEWRSGNRNVTFERFPALGNLYGVDPLVFLTPAEEIEKRLRPHREAIEKFRTEELRKALVSLASLEGYIKRPVQARLFEPGSARQPGRHLQSV